MKISKESTTQIKYSYLFSCSNFLFQTLSSGDTDAVIPVTSTRYSIDALKLPTVTPWHAWYDNDGEVGPSSPQPMGFNNRLVVAD